MWWETLGPRKKSGFDCSSLSTVRNFLCVLMNGHAERHIHHGGVFFSLLVLSLSLVNGVDNEKKGRDAEKIQRNVANYKRAKATRLGGLSGWDQKPRANNGRRKVEREKRTVSLLVFGVQASNLRSPIIIIILTVVRGRVHHDDNATNKNGE